MVSPTGLTWKAVNITTKDSLGRTTVVRGVIIGECNYAEMLAGSQGPTSNPQIGVGGPKLFH